MDPVTNVLAVFVFLAAFSTAPAGFDRMGAARSVCALGDRHSDDITADMARTTFLIAGYRARDLRKDCDNVWHAHATKGGVEIHVTLTQAGAVLAETD